MYNNKNTLRDRIKSLRADMPVHEKQEKDRLLYNNIIASGILRATNQVYIYVSYGTEADTRYLIEKLLQQHKHMVAAPRVNGKEMDFYEIKEMADLKPGFNGIPEPVTGQLVTKCNGIMFMPGLVFDKFHGRIGYGGGYYDRYLSRHKNDNIFKVALAYDFQVLKTEEIIMEAHDIKPDIIITERAAY
ncbi:MAG: 5-formyltetrahydrofolate cyclo-ligase [Lachnospiraceae bacterium]|nr:5-formyltetrahydrofolate cyclo-ligase [Lachnospiraceae bacterium]